MSATFSYKAIDGAGKATSGTLSADSRGAAMDEMTRRGLTPVAIEEHAAAATGLMGRGRRVSAAAVDAFTRELANLLAAGVPLGKALQIIAREASSAAEKTQREAIRDAVVDGEPLAEALARHPRSFPTVYVAMVRAGEMGGFLDVVLNQIADFRAREADLVGRVRAALVYPALLAVMTVLVLAACLVFFIPQFAGFFEEYGAELPVLTRAIMAASEAVLSPWSLAVLVVLAIAGLWATRTLATQSGRRWRDRMMLRLPMVGTVLARFALVRFCRMLGTLLGAGVPLIGALRVAREALGNQTLSDVVEQAIERVQHGESLAKSLGEARQLFPASVTEMVAVAEETGRLDGELTRLANSFEGELDRRLRTLVAMAEPAMLVIMAAVVGTVVVGMLMPILTLQDLIQ
ncbi:type II secretion system F family protein [Phycisphaerales bacterium AB-hyl4]|uniref:Type II secretion system F family protein n=1 Tax=Natronomicrosphaera hydrolytica TaxID=3242702 RepID=A0ABV4TZH2_9BACT